ncbi:hypothetical protein KUH03_31735 [Sphingobacterium sp. E70]|uniref:RNA polymerase sigma factor n=1 Tax=Sphingobacterium sp. E70 TaxID=2853439 RepID=UPI00211C7363|nr:hypothetical protein [Sphingobacterium sp. E70]ULT23691.1 hypothetical protein KUH03_31735 [Sphingobacterium sp. E70]
MQSVLYNDEQELLTKLQQGSSTAFQELYNKYYGLLYLHASQKLQDREAAKILSMTFFPISGKKNNADHSRKNILLSLYSYSVPHH